MYLRVAGGVSNMICIAIGCNEEIFDFRDANMGSRTYDPGM